MPYASQRDRAPEILELEKVSWPAPPLNLFVTSGYSPGIQDIVWDPPSNLAVNQRFSLLGVNLYRSFDSEFGPYDRITEFPIGGTFWRDQTDNVVLLDEVVEDDQWVLRGDAGSDILAPRYVFRTQRQPIVKEGSQNVYADRPSDVVVYINGELATVKSVTGFSGEIEIDTAPYPDVSTQLRTTPLVPEVGATITVSYRYNRTFIRTDLAQRTYYRATAVGTLVGSTELLETPLEMAAFTSNQEIEKLDWIWREAVRRNRWILNQGGERVKVFIKKQCGVLCGCYRPEYGQPLSDCALCFGVGIRGGFEGPYDILLAPPDAEKKIAQQNLGRTVEETYEVWTGPSPLLSQRDFIVKLNGDRYSIGPVRMPTNRGMVLQQHFNIGHLDEKDIRYQVLMSDPNRRLNGRVDPPTPPNNAPAGITDKPNIPDEREIRGRTKVWESITW